MSLLGIYEKNIVQLNFYMNYTIIIILFTEFKLTILTLKNKSELID
ncbi:protein of unknown function [Brochothrix thermosphacta]|nr:hypothetical protein BTH160X_60394 [Brochothrix thermosphacta]SPN71870.1 protein of unknown function [Brochothrix thermosphacta]